MAESPGDLNMNVVSLPVGAIDYEPGNPNEIEPSMMEALRTDIRERGFVQPVIVREVGEGRWRMVDGEHRHQIVAELGYSTIPAVVIDVAEDDEARIRLLTTNRFRGQFMPMPLAMMLADLSQRIPEADLRRRLAMDERELKDTLRLATFTDDVNDTLREAIAKEAADAPIAMRFVVSSRDAEVIERVVASVTGGNVDRGKALAKVCRAWETTKNKES